MTTFLPGNPNQRPVMFMHPFMPQTPSFPTSAQILKQKLPMQNDRNLQYQSMLRFEMPKIDFSNPIPLFIIGGLIVVCFVTK